MPYLVVCPNCAGKFKANQPVAAGQGLVCPTCKKPFTLSEPAPELTEGQQPAGPVRPAAPVPKAVVPPPMPTPPPLRSSIPVGKLEPDLPAAVFVDDDEDDRPPARRPRDADAEEDPPRPRRRRADAVDADRDVAGEPDWPRARRKTKPNRQLIIALAAGGGALVLLLLCGGIVWLANPFGMFGESSSEMLGWLPSDTSQIGYMDVAAVRKHGQTKLSAQNEMSEMTGSLGLKLEDIDAVMTGRGSSGRTWVVKLSSGSKRDSIIQSAGGQEATAAGKTYYRTRSQGAVHFVSGRMLVYTSSEAAMPRLLDKGGKVDLSENMKTATGRARGEIWSAQTNAGFFGGGDNKGAEMFGITAPPQPKYMVSSISLSGSTANVRMEMEFADTDSARRGAEALKKMFDFFKSFAGMGPNDPKAARAREMFGSVDVSRSGTTVTVTMKGPIDSMEGSPWVGGF